MGAGSFNRKVTGASQLLLVLSSIIGSGIITFTLLSQDTIERELLALTVVFYVVAIVSTIVFLRHRRQYFKGRRKRKRSRPRSGPAMKGPPLQRINRARRD